MGRYRRRRRCRRDIITKSADTIFYIYFGIVNIYLCAYCHCLLTHIQTQLFRCLFHCNLVEHTHTRARSLTPYTIDWLCRRQNRNTWTRTFYYYFLRGGGIAVAGNGAGIVGVCVRVFAHTTNNHIENQTKSEKLAFRESVAAAEGDAKWTMRQLAQTMWTNREPECQMRVRAIREHRTTIGNMMRARYMCECRYTYFRFVRWLHVPWHESQPSRLNRREMWMNALQAHCLRAV